LPHKTWWSDYLRDRGGTSFWHETIGLSRIGPAVPAEGPMFAARARADSDRKAARAIS
jgi:hypothetical protein